MQLHKGSVFLLQAFSNVNGFIIPAHAQKLKETMKEKIDVLLENFYEDADLISILPSMLYLTLRFVKLHREGYT